MRKRWVWALVLALVLQGLAFAACAEEETVEPATDETFVPRGRIYLADYPGGAAGPDGWLRIQRA